MREKILIKGHPRKCTITIVINMTKKSYTVLRETNIGGITLFYKGQGGFP